jgi:HTH-type transcriptional regulator/antitoxin HigA
MTRLSTLMDIDPAAGSEEVAELELLALVIEDYERGIVPEAKPTPVDAILFRIEQQGLSRKDLAPFIGSLPKVSEVLSGKRQLSIAMMRRLHHGLGIPADVLIGAEAEEPRSI